jgi:mono/diheme cytochrome c family protein
VAPCPMPRTKRPMSAAAIEKPPKAIQRNGRVPRTFRNTPPEATARQPNLSVNVAVELELEELPHHIRAIHVLHRHTGGVLRQSLGQDGRALLVGPDHLVRPPLVAQLVGADVGRHVDPAGIAVVGDEEDAFRPRDGVGEALGEGALRGGELQHPHLPGPMGAHSWQPMAATADAATVAAGQALFALYCSTCHGQGAVSGGVIPDLRASTFLGSDVFYQIVLDGLLKGAGMASFTAVLDRNDATAIRAYVIQRANEDKAASTNSNP